MLSYLLKIWVMLLFSAVVIFFYYWNKAHIENFDWYFIYFLIVWIYYWIYKFFNLFNYKEKISFTPFEIFTHFFVHLILLSTLFFYYNKSSFWDSLWNWIVLSFKIFFYSLLPILISYISISFWQFFLKNILKNYSEKSSNYRFITGIGFWFFSFIFVLTILWMLGFYNLYSVFAILIIFSILWYKELINNIKATFNYKINCTNHKIFSDKILEKINPKLLSTEFLFIVITLLLSVNLISIFRPFPIGWDDLGAYMNYPHLMASEWSVWFLGSMMSWQTFTWIGYMFNNPTLAFFLNNVWGFVSVIVIALIISEIFKNHKKIFINLGLLASTLFISMPMVVFQQAKDMKLDEGLFFVSIIALYMLFEFYNGYKKVELSKKSILKLFVVIWLLLGFAFTIKFTSLLLISAVIWILFFTRLWILWFLWYLGLYFAIFTIGGFWKMMNVVWLEKSQSNTQLALIVWIVWIAFLVTARVKTKKRFRRFIPRIIALFIWIIIAVSPWAINNINQANKFWINEIISWKAEHFEADYSKIYSVKEIKKLEDNAESLRWISSSWTTTNEDFWRYFGYEKGINNYIKLPWNLTMQKNQGWEFTDIWFLFLALLPALLLFLPFERKYYSLWIYALLFFEILIFVMPITNSLITEFLATFTLPFGYIIILLLFLLPLVFLIPTVQNKDLEKLFKINLIFTIFYTFLWTISAFWIVWYWIVMYFNFILMIIFGAYYLGSYNDKIIPHPLGAPFNTKESIDKEKQIKFFGTLIFMTIIWVYLFMNVFPHSFNNLKNAGFWEYKKWKITTIQAPFIYHRENLNFLYNLNIAEDKREEFIKNSLIWDEIKTIYKNNKKTIWTNINSVQDFLNQLIIDKRVPQEIKNKAQKSLNNIYAWISNPNNKYRSKDIIYRIWTFLKYNISQNNKRLYEDSLLTEFNKYFYDKNPDITVERMKKIWLKYLLVDLNAATIDKDKKRHALTNRYEKILKTFTSNKLELIDTDSVCLRVWLEKYKKDKNIKEYMNIAGVNYDWYTKDWKQIPRTNKLIYCYKEIINLLKNNKVDNKNYSYLLPFKSYLEKLKTENEKISFIHKNTWPWFKVLFKIK